MSDSPYSIIIDLDPDGTWEPWAAVVIERPTGVAYAHQCAGIACEERVVAGCLVPLGGLLLNPDEDKLQPLTLTAPFHDGEHCLTPCDIDRLTQLVAKVVYWQRVGDGSSRRVGLQLDASRSAEIVEGWVPVITPDGSGVLLWTNCD